MYSAYPAPANSFPPPPPPSKRIKQKEYRDKEGECINTLRAIIKQLTGEEPQPRYEVLQKAIELLLSLLEMKRQEQTHVDPSVPSVTAGSNYADTSSAHSAYSSQSHLLQPWQEPQDVESYYTQAAHPHSSGQQYQHHSMSYMDPAFDQTDYYYQ